MRSLSSPTLLLLCCSAGLAQPEVRPSLPLPNSGEGHIVFSRYLAVPVAGLPEPIILPKLFVMDGASGKTAPFFVPGQFFCAKEARWSPDYDQIAFTSDFNEALSACVYDIFTAQTDGSRWNRVTGNETTTVVARGMVHGRIVDNVPRSEGRRQPTQHTEINISAAGCPGIVHPEPDLTFDIPLVAAGESVWIKVWTEKNVGNVVNREVQAGGITDIGEIKLQGANFFASKPSVSPDGRYVVGMGGMLSLNREADNPLMPGDKQTQQGGAINVSLFDCAKGMIVGMLQGTAMLGQEAKDPVFGPDGQSIAMSLGQTGLEGLVVITLDQFLADRPQPRVIVPGERIFPSEATGFQAFSVGAANPAWSPDGNLLAFSRIAMGTELVTGNLWVVRPDGSGLQQVTNCPPNQLCCQPCFAPDGSELVYTVLTGKWGVIKPEHLFTLQFTANIFRVDLEDGTVRQLTNDGQSTEPAWGP